MTDLDALKPSVKATYDSTKDGTQYTITTFCGNRLVAYQPIPDPFICNSTTIGWRDLLRGLLRGKLEVHVHVSGRKERVDDVLELDAQTLIRGRTRHAAFHSHINERLGDF